MISNNEFDSPMRNNHRLFLDNCYLEGSHVKLHQDGMHLSMNIRCNRDLFTTKEIVVRIIDNDLCKINRPVFSKRLVLKEQVN